LVKVGLVPDLDRFVGCPEGVAEPPGEDFGARSVFAFAVDDDKSSV
jgi:hypothetical protein